MRIALVSLLCLSINIVQAQTDSTRNQGEILTGQVVIEKDKKIVLPQADKIFLRSVPKSFSGDPLNLSFEIREPSFEWPAYKSDVPFQSIDESYPAAGYQNYVKMGYGNYHSPLFEAGLFQKLGDVDTRAKLFYERFKTGPVREENSGNSLAGFDISTAYQNSSIAIKPTVSFYKKEYNYYGSASRSTISNVDDPDDASLTNLEVSVDLTVKKEDLRVEMRPYLIYVNQQVGSGSSYNKETLIGASGAFEYKIDDTFTTGLSLEATGGTYRSGLHYDRSLLTIDPWVTFKKNNIRIRSGFAISSGKVAGDPKTGFYPKFRVDYTLTDNWEVYGSISGGQSWNRLNGLLEENEFLDDSLILALTENTLEFGGGIKGNPIKNVLFETSLTYRSVKGMPFYTPSAPDSSRYTLSYDTDAVDVISLEARFSFMPTATSTYGADLEINGYSVETLDKPWHKPSYELKAYTSHHMLEKLIVSGYVTSIGGIRAPAIVDFGYVKLPVIFDAGIGVRYQVTTAASAFIEVNNLLNNEYERYLGYPTRGITFKIGGQYRF